MNHGQGCTNDPGVDSRRQQARCHVCGKVRSCGFCNICCHWFCDECNPKIFTRAAMAVKEMLGGPAPDCCGPVRALFNLQIVTVLEMDDERVVIRSAHDAEPIVLRPGLHGLIINPTQEEIDSAMEHLASGAFGVLP